jgi:hypothetical protein
MIDPARLSEDDVGRLVIYHREHCNREEGKLSSWNDKFVFVRFKGPGGEACEPSDVSFALGNGVYGMGKAKEPTP